MVLMVVLLELCFADDIICSMIVMPVLESNIGLTLVGICMCVTNFSDCFFVEMSCYSLHDVPCCHL